jgi:hypothetical protein
MLNPKTMHEIDPGKGAFAQAFGVDIGVLPWLGTPEGAGLMKKFAIGVPWLSSITVVATRTDLPWDRFGSTICDVGCGPGSVMLEVKKKFPHLKLICQDLDYMAPVIKEVCAHSIPSGQEARAVTYDEMNQTFKGYEDDISKGQIQIQPHDYFTPQTQEADVYWLRGVVLVKTKSFPILKFRMAG